MNRSAKSAVIDRLREALADAPAVVVADFKGLTVEQSTGLRSESRKLGIHYEVVKNTLARAAIAETPKENLSELLKGNSAIAFHPEDPSAAAKLLRAFAKDNKQLVIRGGWVDGQILDTDGVQTLSTLPGKDELRAKVLGLFSAVPTKFVRTLNAAGTTFVQVLIAREQQLSGESN